MSCIVIKEVTGFRLFDRLLSHFFSFRFCDYKTLNVGLIFTPGHKHTAQSHTGEEQFPHFVLYLLFPFFILLKI